MKNNVVGIVISVIVLFMSLIVLPTYFIGIVNWRNDRAICLSAARNFVDMVIDKFRIGSTHDQASYSGIVNCT